MKTRTILQALLSLFGTARQSATPAAKENTRTAKKKPEPAGTASRSQKERPASSRTGLAGHRNFHTGENASLQDLARRYEKELMNRQFCFPVQYENGKKETVVLEFEAGNFCHLFSVASIADRSSRDLEPYCGTQGWNNIRSGKITLESLQKLDPEDFDFYHQEFYMFDELLQTLQHPKIVEYDPRKVKGSKLKADLLVYGLFDGPVIHLALSRGQDGIWFPRSFFIREESREKAWPTKYIEPMRPVKLTGKMSIKKA